VQTPLLETLQSTTDDVYKAVRAVAHETPLLGSPALDGLAGRQLFVKAESPRHTWRRGLVALSWGGRGGVVCSGGNISPDHFTALLTERSHH
jgi:hypothetical protein